MAKNNAGRGWTLGLGLALCLVVCKGAWPQTSPGTLSGYEGWWLKNPAAEAFIIAEPYPRIIAFQRSSSVNLRTTG